MHFSCLPDDVCHHIFDLVRSRTHHHDYAELAGFAASSKNNAGVVSRYVIGRMPPSSVMHRTSRIGCMPVVYELLSGVGIGAATTPNDDGETPLHQACRGGQIRVVREFLYNRTDVDSNARDVDGRTPLNFMLDIECYNERPTGDVPGTLRLLLSHDAVDVNASDVEGNTPLHKASTQANKIAQVAVPLLLSRGSDVNAVNSAGRMPHQQAINGGPSEDVVRMILEDPRLDKQHMVETIVRLLRPRSDLAYYYGFHYDV